MKTLTAWVTRCCVRGMSLMLMFAAGVQAQDFDYTNTNGTITITGYTGPGGAVSIPRTIAALPVTRIGGLAFNNQSSVTTVAIPDSVTSFESGLAPAGGAFGFCTGLTTIAIPNSVTNIGDYAFVFCSHMMGVYFQGNSPSLGAQVFQNDTNLTVFYLPGTTGWGPTFGGRPTAVWNQARDFTYTNTNGTITITGYTGPGGNVAIPSTMAGLPVTSIEDNAFAGVTILTGVTIPNSVTNLGEQAFFGCSSMANLSIGNGITTIHGGADSSGGGGVGGTFQNCTSLTRVAIPDSVTNIGDGPDTIGGPAGAFFYCTSLTNVTVGRGLTYLGLGTFSLCTNLTGVYFRGNA
ncbi:MAG: leucine-rich repeat domain-containing protein, partial [Candidatus Dormibacteraceae bacterium]